MSEVRDAVTKAMLEVMENPRTLTNQRIQAARTLLQAHGIGDDDGADAAGALDSLIDAIKGNQADSSD